MPQTLQLEHATTTAPRRLFRALVDPEELAAWFGPDTSTVPVESVTIDPRVGGQWSLTLVDKQDPSQTSPANATITAYEEGRLLEAEETTEGETYRLRLEVRPETAGSTLVVSQGPLPDNEIEAARAGWQASFGKLDQLVTPTN
ncbi:hypothetical protein G9U51_03440 [Calidifontibacter sp. DB0510]|uniref:Activator of Hsp90 ATPase homologue 1/2-like C-terminal domain-containing protein n=1 Tax=Metallococcus carri TaxID=1656884 RepID=A0A967B384_9MICO|nr:SRPBCC domain-containing protein [Metallococcus carri]NHN54837.1 hypothetical protein [Metallococcus carri]NOP37182.1 hypothetical protein [Calidifontibacter sp. DB2511S]